MQAKFTPFTAVQRSMGGPRPALSDSDRGNLLVDPSEPFLAGITRYPANGSNNPSCEASVLRGA